MNKKKQFFCFLDKHFFKSKHSIFVSVFLIVFFIIILTGVLTFICISTYRLLGHFPTRFEAPIVMMFITLLISAIIGTILSTIVTRTIIKRVDDLQKAMHVVQTGDFSVRLERTETHGHIDEVFKSFNQMVDELNSIEVFRDDFINSFSHEFKTPIVSIQGFAKQLKKENLSDEKREEYIDIIISESKRLTNLSTNILLLNKFENQQYITNFSDFYLDEQIRSSILLLEKQWNEKNISFDINLEIIPFYTNQEMLSQAWLNILSNSIKFSPKNSTITINSSIKNNKIRIDFIDTGIGMDESTINHIFDRFYQGDSARSGEGNGLGLPLVKRIIELCQGTIRVESQINKGTMFSVFFNSTNSTININK